LVDTQTYRVVTNNFLQGGGDGFATMAKGTNVYYGGLDIDAFANYLEANSPYTPGPLTRITAN
jgi:5'-nucleotidase